MKFFRHFLLLTLLSQTAASLHAQDTLPRFTLRNLGNNRIIIGWTNTYTDVRQISIQRSYDSLVGYKSILTVPDPTSQQNGYADMKAPNDHMFYRLYIQLDQGRYLFSAAQRPAVDSMRNNGAYSGPPVNPPQPLNIRKTDRVVKDTIFTYDSVTRAQPFVVRLNGFPSNDSVVNPNPVALKNRTNTFVPSLYVYTSRDGYVRVTLPDREKAKKYVIKFFEEDNTPIFELKDLKETDFRIDKANFYHAGWFRFEIYEDGKLLEKQRFYLEREF